MPRRRLSKGNSASNKKGKGSSVKRWNNREDIPLDEVDQFQEQRDKILLEGEEVAPDDDYDDDEVFALKGLAESSDEDEEDFYNEDDELEEEEEEKEEKKSTKKKKKSKEKEKTKPVKGKFAESSEDEDNKEDEEDIEESWGTKKSAYYSSNAALLESDDEEGHELEEQEARRLQAKLREPLREEDFGYDEALQRTVDMDCADDFWKPVEAPATTVGMDKQSILRHLEKTSPETLALAFEWDDIANSVAKTERILSETPDDVNDKSLGLIHLFHQTQLTYASLLAFYLYLRASTKYSARPELLREHPILKRLLTLKQSLTTLEDLGFNASDSEDGSGSDDLEDDESDELDSWLSTGKLELNELEELLAEEAAAEATKVRKETKFRSGKKLEQPLKKKKKIAKEQTVPSVVFDVEEPSLSTPGPSSSSSTSGKKVSSSSLTDVSGFGEATSLDDADAADKGGRRKALRFHTAKIESASNRRKAARLAVGGDDDLPYRDRKKDSEKQKRKNLGAGGDDLDDSEPPSESLRKRLRIEESDGSGSEDEEDGYYSLVKKQKSAKKADKKAAYDAMKEANRVEHEEDVADGQRSITRAILKNKGLTPKRGKSVRNPRVKKRQKFEKAKKRVSSQKAVYKGGIGDSGYYGGEMSGISKVIKSVQL